MTIFSLDPFQKLAIQAIKQGRSVFVSAPTGSGKTVIAEEAIDQSFSTGQRVIYTSPVKALSNQKFRDFRKRYGDDSVGILTGDVSLNPDAKLLVMTTEIYRNTLFENSDRINDTAWVIFDEIHYLDDPERGTVWEEAILFTPDHIQILGLSATAPNIEQVAEWIRTTHDKPVEVIIETHRPVPLEMIYQCDNQFYTDSKRLLQNGYRNRDDWTPTAKERRMGIRWHKFHPNRLEDLIEILIRKNQLPAIYFVFGRKRAEELAWDACFQSFLKPGESEDLSSEYLELLKRYDLAHEKSAQDMVPLIENGIAYHHAGMLPSLKEVIEQLFTSRKIKLIFTTETFAIGINMPARSVIFDGLEKFYGTGFKHLTTRDFYQMAGRAGRRGIDSQGTVWVRIRPSDIPFSALQRIIYGKPEPIRSQLNASYATLLNLYKQLGSRLHEVYPKSFHHFQSQPKARGDAAKMIEKKLEFLTELGYMNEAGLTLKGEFASQIFGYELLLSEMQEQGILDQLDPALLSVLLAALVFEPRKGDHPPHLRGRVLNLARSAEQIARDIRRNETKYRILPHTRSPHFNLAASTDAWVGGADFDAVLRLTTSDEGEWVRAMRMVVQLLREIMHAPHCSEKLQATAHRARVLINRGVVDAEKQLRA